MKNLSIALTFVFLVILSISCQTTPIKKNKPLVLCSIAPYTQLVNRIAGKTVNIETIVPQKADIHTYDPTIQEVKALQGADLWFYIGEPIEKKLKSVLLQTSTSLEVIDLKKGLPLISHSSCCSHQDLHIWLSPKLLKNQVQTIKQSLQQRFPNHFELYEANASALLNEVTQLDEELTNLFANQSKKSFLISHSALAYFARDYSLTQLSIESEGKDPTSHDIIILLQNAGIQDIDRLFVVPQMDQKKPKILAKSLGLQVYSFDPYKENCLSNLKEFAYHLVDQSNPNP